MSRWLAFWFASSASPAHLYDLGSRFMSRSPLLAFGFGQGLREQPNHYGSEQLENGKSNIIVSPEHRSEWGKRSVRAVRVVRRTRTSEWYDWSNDWSMRASEQAGPSGSKWPSSCDANKRKIDSRIAMYPNSFSQEYLGGNEKTNQPEILYKPQKEEKEKKNQPFRTEQNWNSLRFCMCSLPVDLESIFCVVSLFRVDWKNSFIFLTSSIAESIWPSFRRFASTTLIATYVFFGPLYWQSCDWCFDERFTKSVFISGPGRSM